MIFSHEAAGVICATQSAGVPKDCLKKGKICLVGGNSAASGNVYVGGQPLCHNGWDYADANVVCRSLGYIGKMGYRVNLEELTTCNYSKNKIRGS